MTTPVMSHGEQLVWRSHVRPPSAVWSTNPSSPTTNPSLT
eukprot:CAMPEP_0198222440 /NCGR_PEP_ID=MMETSP1445-20131203/88099_1 /TAXON_ID=36898 /ORGANISM="Pyramimonas sp., Strain CCMP2087" /LENGTH=39 /DNA_ID= /DNA_START= /DNA_END= /DNA_ORIENTATION=